MAGEFRENALKRRREKVKTFLMLLLILMMLVYLVLERKRNKLIDEIQRKEENLQHIPPKIKKLTKTKGILTEALTKLDEVEIEKKTEAEIYLFCLSRLNVLKSIVIIEIEIEMEEKRYEELKREIEVKTQKYMRLI